MYSAIRREILRRGGKPLAHGETLTLTTRSSGGIIASAAEPEAQKGRSSMAVPNPNEQEPFSCPPGPLG